MSAKALKRFNSMAIAAQAQLDKFKVEFDKDPAYALSWGLTAFQSAARLTVAKMFVEAFTVGESGVEYNVEQAKGYLMDRVMSKARYPAQSTSPTSNLMEQYEAAAYAEALDELEYLD